MTENNQQEISLASGFEAVVRYGGTTIKLHPDAGVDVYTKRDVDAYTSGAVRLHPMALVGEGHITEIIGETKPDAVVGEGVVTEIIGESSATNALSRKVVEVGDQLRDGTVVIAVDLKNNTALFAPAAIFGGKARFDHQHDIPANLNRQKYLGHEDWRNITDDEGKTLSQVWDKVAPDELKGRHGPWFWVASPIYKNGHVRRGGVADWDNCNRGNSFPVPVVRSGPAQS